VKRLAVLLAGLSLGACYPRDSPVMEPGRDCMDCHKGRRLPWTAAGTVFPSQSADVASGVSGAEVWLRDANGLEVHLTTNSSGNFYTAEALTFPLHAEVHRNGNVLVMPQPAATGGCNGCHNVPASGDATGRIAAP
jgi:hypothetical protein